MSACITRVEAIPARVPFRQSFVIGRGAVGSAGSFGEHVFVRMETDDGHVGWGEVRALPSWSYETFESITWAIRHYFAELLIGRTPFEANAVQAAMYERLTPAVSQGQPFARAAIDIALHDLAGRIAGVPIHALLGGRTRDRVSLCYAISIATPEEMAAVAAAAPECGCFKVKVAGEPDLDERRVRAVAEARPDADLWLDANQSYQAPRLLQFLGGLTGVRRIFCIEQPVRSVDWFGLRQARHGTDLPVAADEGCFSAHDVARIARLDAADLVVLKVKPCGQHQPRGLRCW